MRKFHRKDYELENGELQAYAWPGGYPVFYVTADGGVLCPTCASCKEVRQAVIECPDDDQWRVVAADVNYEDDALFCDNCNERIESAYGDPDAQTEGE